MSTKLFRDLTAGDKVLSDNGEVLTIRGKPVQSMIRGELMVSHNGDPDWTSAHGDSEVQLVAENGYVST